jgi:hypothetical protein
MQLIEELPQQESALGRVDDAQVVQELQIDARALESARRCAQNGAAWRPEARSQSTQPSRQTGNEQVSQPSRCHPSTHLKFGLGVETRRLGHACLD